MKRAGFGWQKVGREHLWGSTVSQDEEEEAVGWMWRQTVPGPGSSQLPEDRLEVPCVVSSAPSQQIVGAVIPGSPTLCPQTPLTVGWGGGEQFPCALLSLPHSAIVGNHLHAAGFN